ncbi:TIM barrel protein [Candidatus Woesearchaeota archaeon]|nr:TIM barrel protein [Candidatus Woesearchaeota archaeon]
MISIGPAGTGGNTLEGLKKASACGFTALEIPFTHGVRMGDELAQEAGSLAKKLKIRLSVHAPYYINLASDDRLKITQSEKRILDSCAKGHLLGADYIVFHAGFYQQKTGDKTYSMVKQSIIRMQERIRDAGWKKVILAPEITGKPSQFGDMDELLRLKKEAGCGICIDFAHLEARQAGNLDYDEVFSRLKNLKHIHSHFSGIEYSEKGERRHVLTPAARMKELLTYVKKHGADITVINESPDPFGDSARMLKVLGSIF